MSERTAGGGYLLHLALFLATCVTTTWAGIVFRDATVGWTDWPELWRRVPLGLPYSLSIMSILLTHEMGHYLLARRHRVDASLPYFIPLPHPMLGTLGAVIRMRGKVTSREALADIGAAGPLAGLVVALPVLAFGVHLSPVGPSQPLAMLEGNSLLYLAVKYLIKGAVLPGGGQDVFLHPMAWAGWVGLLVTMLNLIPIGQLDGGHVAYAYFGARNNTISLWLHRGLLLMFAGTSAYAVLEQRRIHPWPQAVALGWSGGLQWLVWFILLQGMKRLTGGEYHPPVDGPPLSPGRRRLCLAMFLIFALILVPIPLRPAA